jgi:hypothetical protein
MQLLCKCYALYIYVRTLLLYVSHLIGSWALHLGLRLKEHWWKALVKASAFRV